MRTSDMMELMTREEKLVDELVPYVTKSDVMGQMIHHPLIIEMFYRPGYCARINEHYRYKVQAKKMAEEKGDWETYIWLHERPYRIRALQIAMSRGATAPRLVRNAWMDSENIWQNKSAWEYIWSHLESPLETMDANERTVHEWMPERVTIHRGIRRPRYSRRGMSWTRDKERAVWFAHRHAGKDDSPTVLTAHVLKRNVLAFFNGRGEEEVVVLPRHIRGITE